MGIEIRAVDMVRSIREDHYEKLLGLSPQEKIAFFREKARSLYKALGTREELLDYTTSTSSAKPHG